MQSPFPLVCRADLQGHQYHGFVAVNDLDYRIRVSKGVRDGDPLFLEMEPALKQILKAEEDVIRQRLLRSVDIMDFLTEFKEIIDRISTVQISHAGPQAEIMERIIADIEAVGWANVVHLHDTFQTIHIMVEDQAHRQHVLEIDFASNYPLEVPRCRAALPGLFVPRWSNRSSLVDLVNQFREALAQFQDLWDVLDDLDHNTWVLEPERPTRDAVMRRIAIGNHCSMQLDLDPAKPRDHPAVRFLGADSVILPYRDMLNEKLPQWDASFTVRKNLQNALGFEFPTRQVGEEQGLTKEDVSVECAICYSYRLDGALPDVVCDNRRCGRPFHGRCLYEWLRAVPTSRQSFNTLYGPCTYCGQSIAVRDVSGYQ